MSIDNKFTQIVYQEDEEGSTLQIDGFESTIRNAILNIVQAGADMSGKPVKSYIAELMLFQIMVENHDCKNCDEQECKASDFTKEHFETQQDWEDFNFEEIGLFDDFDLEGSDE